MSIIFNYNSPPKIGETYAFFVSLISQSDTDIFQANPTLAAGDVKVSKDGGAYNNITTLPTGTANNKVLGVLLSVSEMTANQLSIIFSDAAGSEWQDCLINILTMTGTVVSNHTASDIWSVATRTLTSFGTLITDIWNNVTRTLTSFGTLDDDVADTVWDELLAGHAGAGSAGASLSAAGSSADPLLNTVPGTYAAGTGGYALGRIGSGQITTTSIVAQSGDVETYRGDSYLDADGRRIDWTDVDAEWPILTGASILVVIGGDISFTGTVITATGASKKVGVELTSAQSSTIPQGKLEFIVRATLLGGSVITLLSGNWTSKRQLVVGS